MNSKPGPITGSWLLTPKVHADSRGQFVESFQKGVFAEQTGLSIDFIQDNEVVSEYGIIRGLHLQNDPHGQAKLIRVVLGKIYDVAVDLRADSSTYGEWFGVELSADNQTQLFLPKGFAHGYSVLSKRAIVQYKVIQFTTHKQKAAFALMTLTWALTGRWTIPFCLTKT